MDWKSPNIVRSHIFERWLANELNEPTLNNRVQCEPEEIGAEEENEILRAEIESLDGVIHGKNDQIDAQDRDVQIVIGSAAVPMGKATTEKITEIEYLAAVREQVLHTSSEDLPC